MSTKIQENCPRCGANLTRKLGVMFCHNCGAPLRPSQPERILPKAEGQKPGTKRKTLTVVLIAAGVLVLFVCVAVAAIRARNSRQIALASELCDAAADGELGNVERLLAHGAEVNAKNSSGMTPLHLAAGNGHKDVAELLLAHGAEVNAKNSSGMTPLHLAAGNGHKDVAELLLAHGAEVNAKDNFGNTPLHCATIPETGVMQLLLAHGADVNAKEIYGFTPLHYQALCGREDSAKVLLSHGADVNAKNKEGRTPLDCATDYGHVHVVELLLASGAKR
jgi:ankyrin repeat protein